MYSRHILGWLVAGDSKGSAVYERREARGHGLKPRVDHGQVQSFWCLPFEMNLLVSELLVAVWCRETPLKSAFPVSPLKPVYQPLILVHIQRLSLGCMKFHPHSVICIFFCFFAVAVFLDITFQVLFLSYKPPEQYTVM